MNAGPAERGHFMAGTAVVDLHPPAGTAMAGFAARTRGSTGVHDPLSVRALAVDNTVLITVDVCGLHEETCTSIARRLPLPQQNIAITATHTHAGPCVMPGRLGGHDPELLEQITEACCQAAEKALASRQAATLSYGHVRGVGVAKNRRHPNRDIDPPVQLAAFTQPHGEVIAWILTYPCHPVVLGPDNHLISGDFPAFARAALEAEAPGSVCLFLPGTPGDVNTGHSAQASYTIGAASERTLGQAKKVGRHVATCALQATLLPVPAGNARHGRGTASAQRSVRLRLQTRDAASPDVLAWQWSEEAAGAEEGRRALLNAWIQWSKARQAEDPAFWEADVTVFRWGGLTLVGLPGEPFLAATEAIAARVRGPVLVTGYTNGCPGYFPPSDEYASGGYEVDDAHRYYGMPAPFAPGSAEALVEAAVELIGRLS